MEQIGIYYLILLLHILMVPIKCLKCLNLINSKRIIRHKDGMNEPCMVMFFFFPSSFFILFGLFFRIRKTFKSSFFAIFAASGPMKVTLDTIQFTDLKKQDRLEIE